MNCRARLLVELARNQLKTGQTASKGLTGSEVLAHNNSGPHSPTEEPMISQETLDFSSDTCSSYHPE